MPTGVSRGGKCKPLGCMRDRTEITVFLVCWSLAMVLFKSGGVSGGPTLRGVCRSPWYRVLLRVGAVACGSSCFTVFSDGSCNSGCSNLGLYFFPGSSKISHLCLFGMEENPPALFSDCWQGGSALHAARDPEYTWLLGAVGAWPPTALGSFVVAS